MKQKYSFFLLLIAIAASFSACITTDDSFGVDFIPTDQKTSVGVYSFKDFPIYTAVIDSIATTTLGVQYTTVFGSMNVPPFGNVNANAVLRIYPYVSDHRFGEHPEFISAELTLVVSKVQAADEDQKNIVQNIRLYELSKTLYYDTTYYNTSVTKDDYNPLPVNLPGTTYHGEDTLIIPITKAYGDFLMTATDNEMDSLTPFYAKYKGFVLGVDSLYGGATGGRLNTIDVSLAYLTLKYKTEEGIDTSFIYYGDYGLEFSSIHHSSAPLANYTNPPTSQSQTIYFEGLAGVKPVIDLLPIKDSINAFLAKKNLLPDQLLINKLDIVVSIPPSANMDNYPSQLTFCSRNVSDSGKLTYPIITDAYTTTFDGAINRSLLSYSFNIALYMQRILKQDQAGNITDPTLLYLFPMTTVEDVYGTSYNIIDNINYTYGEFLGTGSASSVKLNLVYTVLP